MKITKTTLLFIATLFFLALPLMFVNGSAQAAYPGYNWTGAEHNADGGWTMPADNGTCIGADANTPVDSNAQSIGLQGALQNCTSVQPAWVSADFPTQATCEAAGYHWGGSCKNATGDTGHHHDQASCESAGGVWTAGPCGNLWTDDTSAAYTAGTGAHWCLYCHDGGHGYNMSGYLKSAHANATRPTVDNHAWVTPIEEGSTAYTASGGNAIDWTNDTLNGTQMYWMFGSWLEGAADSARIIYSGESSGAAWVGCNRCHATGFEADATADSNLVPYRVSDGTADATTDAHGVFGPSFSLAGGNVSASDFNGTTQNWAGWQQWGITCSRCHNAMNGGHANSGTGTTQLNGLGFPATNLNTNDVSTDPTSGAAKLVVCYQCHYQNDGKDLRDSRVTYPGTQLVNSGNSVERHANGYLNSPHAMFTGTYGQLGDSTAYNSGFITEFGSCTGCHNVHDSVTDNAPNAKSWNNECGLNCHTQDPATDPYAKPLSAINHPTGPGTPLYGVGADNPVEACQVCHMPGGIHLFRISTDPSYSLGTTGQTYLNTVDVTDRNGNTFAQAYVDLDMACGQCHGGSAGQSATTNGAPYMDKADLAAAASVMHDGTYHPSQVAFKWWVDSSTSGLINFAASASSCPTGVTCTYSWTFGDGGTDTGVAVSHQYGSPTDTTFKAETVTLTVSGAGSTTQVVDPTAVHTAPTNCGNSTVALQAGSTTAVTFTDATDAGTDTSPAVYVNWGDGSPLSVASLHGSVNHNYIWPNSVVGYKVTEIVQDAEGFNCTYTTYMKIGSATVGANSIALSATGAWTPAIIDPATGLAANPQPGVTYVVRDASGLTKATGTVALNATGVTTGDILPADISNYTVTFYYPTGHSCTPTSATTTSNSGALDASSGSAGVTNCN